MLRLPQRLLLAALCAPLLAAAPVAPPPSALPAEAAPAPGSGRRLLDRIVAVVEQQPLLLSELELEARVALIGQGGLGAARAPLSDEDLARALDYVIGQKLAFAEAERLQVFPIEDAEVAEAVREFAARFPSPRDYLQFFVQLEATEEQLAAIVRRDLRVGRFLDSKVKRAARVSEEEMRRFYQQRASDFAGQAYPQVREGIRAVLVRERYRELAAEQLKLLRAKGDIRRLAFLPDEPAKKPAASPTAGVDGAAPTPNR